MPSQLNFNCAATIIGSVPYTDAGTAWTKIGKYLKDCPAWPQLPMRSNLENMYIQFSEGFPGIVINDQKISLERNPNFDQLIERIFSDSFDDKADNYPTSKEYAAGLHYFAAKGSGIPPLIKGQITGPISWGLCVTDSSGRGIIYDETLAEAIAKFLKLKVSWQESLLKRISKQTMIFIDEPYLASLGSAFVAISSDQVSLLIEEVLSGINGLKGIHCCGGTDWSLLLKLPVDIISFDAYNYLDSILCYPHELASFLKRGGSIAWGIVPNDEETLKKESLAELYDRFGEALTPLTRDGTPVRELIARSLITPTCGLASLSPDAAEFALNLLNQLSERIRHKYCS